MYFKSSILIVLYFISSFSIAGEKVIKIATLPDYAPFCMLDKNSSNYQTIPVGKNAIGFDGLSWDIIKESFHEMGYTIKLSIMPWARALHSFKMGDTDMLFPASKNKDRNKIFNYSSNSVAASKVAIYVLPDSKIIWKDLTSIEDLTIGGKRGFNYGDKWLDTPLIKKHHVTTISQGFKMLTLNRFDGYICYEFSCDELLRKHNETSKYKKLPPFELLKAYALTLKSNPKGVKILNDFDTGFKRVVESGRFEIIKLKWFGYNSSFLNCLKKDSARCEY